jgi:hypothetical protein
MPFIAKLLVRECHRFLLLDDQRLVTRVYLGYLHYIADYVVSFVFLEHKFDQLGV